MILAQLVQWQGPFQTTGCIVLPPDFSSHTSKSGEPRSFCDFQACPLWWESRSGLRQVSNIQQHITFALKFDEGSLSSVFRLNRSATWALGATIHKNTESIIITTSAIIIICKIYTMCQIVLNSPCINTNSQHNPARLFFFFLPKYKSTYLFIYLLNRNLWVPSISQVRKLKLRVANGHAQVT